MTELHAVATLQNRYGLKSRQAVYDRINALKIQYESRGKLSSEAVDKLDELDKWLKANPNSSIAEFPRSGEVVSHESSVISHQTSDNNLSTVSLDKSDDFNETLVLIEAIARQIALTRDPLQHYAALERAIASGWLLSTSEVRSLIGTKPTGDRFQRGSFVFIRSGKIGSQTAWRISKIVQGNYKF